MLRVKCNYMRNLHIIAKVSNRRGRETPGTEVVDNQEGGGGGLGTI